MRFEPSPNDLCSPAARGGASPEMSSGSDLLPRCHPNTCFFSEYFHILDEFASFEPSQQLRRPRAQASRFAVVVFGTSMTLACRTQIYSWHSPQEETMCPLFVFFFGK